MLASVVMTLGYGIIAVPTGIVTVELNRTVAGDGDGGRACRRCGLPGLEADARHCRRRGEPVG
jgi:voltage-gated potassium channel